MIHYDGGDYQLALLFHIKGSIFPKVAKIASPPAILTILVNLYLSSFESPALFIHEKQASDSGVWITDKVSDTSPRGLLPGDTSAFTAFTWVLGFFVVFRTSQAYTRYWDGANLLHTVTTEWFDSCAQFTAFAMSSKGTDQQKKDFCCSMVRLFSLLHCSALQQVTVRMEDQFEVIDLEGLPQENLETLLKYDDPKQRTEVVLMWIVRLALEAIGNGTITTPPPIVSRSFQELNSGMTALMRMMTITDTPFPFPYAQMTTVFLIFHWLITPFLLGALQIHWAWSGTFAFISVFSLWSLNLIAAEIEQPFGDDSNDLEFPEKQVELNHSLMMLVDPAVQTPPIPTPMAVDLTHAHARLSLSSEAGGPSTSGTGSDMQRSGPMSGLRGIQSVKVVAQGAGFEEESSEKSPPSKLGQRRVNRNSEKGLKGAARTGAVQSEKGSVAKGASEFLTRKVEGILEKKKRAGCK